MNTAVLCQTSAHRACGCLGGHRRPSIATVSRIYSLQVDHLFACIFWIVHIGGCFFMTVIKGLYKITTDFYKVIKIHSVCVQTVGPIGRM